MRFHQVFQLLLLFSLCGSIAKADEFAPLPCNQLREGTSGRVIHVDDGDTVTLADGRRVRLVGLQAPKLPLGRKDFVAWPLGEESRSALVDLVQNQDVALFYGGRDQDRYRRELAHLFRLADGLWIQGHMIEVRA